MKGQGFRNVDLGDLFLRISLPFSAWVSISHRISGLVLFFGVGLCLYALGLAMESPEGFLAAKELLSDPIPMVDTLALVFFLIFHVLILLYTSLIHVRSLEHYNPYQSGKDRMRM